MYDKPKTTITVLATAVALLSLGGLVGARTVASPCSQGVTPSFVSYQGRVTTNGSPYNDAGYFKFAIVNSAGNTTYWSNDGSSTTGQEPTGAVELDVEDGLFNVMLGDSSLSMPPLTAPVFSGSDRYLRVWFSSHGASFDQLTPDQQLASVPYALRAQDAHTLDGHEAGDFALASETGGGPVPSDAMVLGRTPSETSLINSGFEYTGRIVGDTWRVRADMPTPRREAAAVAEQGIVYTIGGWLIDTFPISQATNEAYHPDTNCWTSKASMVTPRHELGVTTVDGRIYAIGGTVFDGSTVTAANEVYDPSLDSWSIKTPLPSARGGLAAATVDGIIYAIGGQDAYQGEPLGLVEAYDPETDSWNERAPRPTACSGLVAEVVDGVIYTFGPGTVVEAYDPDTNSWSAKASMPTERFSFQTAVVDGIIHAIGGNIWGSDYAVGTNEAYDPETDTWQGWNLMQTPRFWFAAASVRDSICAFGGYSERRDIEFHSTECYTPPMHVYSKQ